MTATKTKKKAKTKWEWSDGTRHKADPNAIGRMIDRLARDGPVDAARFVEAARDPNSPAHGEFDWDVGRAAQAHWEETARCIIRHCQVVYSDASGSEIKRVGYINVSTPEGKGYLPATKVMSTRDLRKQALDDAYRLLKGVRDRIADLKELASVVEAIDEALEEWAA